MEKYIIVKTDSETKLRTYLKGDDKSDFKWVEDHNEANHYCDYDLAMLDWSYAIRWYNPNGDRIFIPVYDPTSPPWN